MKVKDLIQQLQNCNPNANITINGNEEISAVWDCPLSAMVDITSVPQEEEIEEEASDFFARLAEELEQAQGEYLDALKINGVR